MAKIEYSIRSRDETGQGVKSAQNNLKGFEDTARRVSQTLKLLMGGAALGGLTMAFRAIAREVGAAETAFAKLHPELQMAAGSLTNWNKAMEGLKAAMGGVFATAISPFRAGLIEIVKSLTDAINKTNDLRTAITLLQVSQSPQAAAYLKRIYEAQAQLADLEKQRAAAIAPMTTNTGALIGGAWAASGNYQSAANPINQLNKATAEWDEKLKKSQADLDKLVKEALGYIAPPAAAKTTAAQESATAIVSAVRRLVYQGAPTLGGEMRADKEAAALITEPIVEAITELSTYSEEGENLVGRYAYEMEGPGPFAKLMESLNPLISSFTSLTMLLNPWQTILQAMITALQPVVDELLGPLVGALTIIGQLFAAIITPALQILGPIIEFVCDIFVFLYNYAILPVANVFISLFNILKAFGTMIYYLITFQWGKLGSINWNPQAGTLTPIDINSLETAGTAAINNQNTGTTSTYSEGRDINVYVTVNSEVIATDGGIRSLALMINREIQNAVALGVA